ncbi:hypothetical protein D3C78_591170 [compost metagenome]
MVRGIFYFAVDLWFPRSRVGTHPGTLLRPFRRGSVENRIPTRERGNDHSPLPYASMIIFNALFSAALPKVS